VEAEDQSNHELARAYLGAPIILWNLIEALPEAIQGGTQIHGKISGVEVV
jgi:hypothetical protein